MLFVGIDIGKNNPVASMLDENGKVVFKAFSFSNPTDGGVSEVHHISGKRFSRLP